MIGKYALTVFAVIGLASSLPQCGSTIFRKYYSTVPMTVPVQPTVVRLIRANLIEDRPTTTELDTDGPETPPLPIIQAPGVTLPTIEAPLVTLPSPPIPAPRVLSERCICTKTVVKPQIIQRSITVPKIHRFLKRTYLPVIEKIAYKARPKSSSCCNCCRCYSSKKSSGGNCLSPKIC